MTEAQRHQILLDLLAQTGFVTVEQVMSRLGISPATARRDINKLDESGKLKKVRNGAEAISEQRPRWTPMNIHQAQNLDEKVRIARAASQLIAPGESIVINCGSTAFLLGRELCGKPVQIITNYLPLANYLIDQEHDSVIIMGGQYNRSHAITLSPHGSENSLYAGHWMFTSGKGLTAEGLYKTDMLTAMAEQKMLNVVGKLAVLVDSSKIGERAGMLFSQAGQIDVVITGKQADAAILKQLDPRLKMLLKKGDRRGQRLWRNAMADAFLPDTGQPGGKIALPQRLLKTEGIFRRHHVIGIAMPEQ